MFCGLTFEVRRDQRQDARPGPVKMYAYHRPGPGGLPLGLASTEGLGVKRADSQVVQDGESVEPQTYGNLPESNRSIS